MSQRLISHVIDFAAVDGDDLLLLLCIAIYSDDSGVCHLSLTNLAELTRISLRRVNKLLRELYADAFLDLTMGSGRFDPCAIRILAVDYDGPVPTAVDSDTPSDDEEDDGDDFAALFA